MKKEIRPVGMDQFECQDLIRHIAERMQNPKNYAPYWNLVLYRNFLNDSRRRIRESYLLVEFGYTCCPAVVVSESPGLFENAGRTRFKRASSKE